VSVEPMRHKLHDPRYGITHKVHIYSRDGQQQEGYITANVDENGRLREVFLTGWGKSGSTLEGWVQAFAVMLSISLQYGAELPMICRKLSHMKFEPFGETDNPEIPEVKSVIDYIVRWLAIRYGDEELQKEMRAHEDVQPTS
jgi:ribonucleoside-diphosphate reductase alpha chain